MSQKIRQQLLASLRTLRESSGLRAGKVTVLTLVFATVGIVFAAFFLLFEMNVPVARADDVQTSVTVLNTPPQWTVYAHEDPESSTTTPTNIGSAVTWKATGTDSNAENYYLLICKTSGAATAVSSGVPTCAGGIGNRWAVSAATASGAEATAATTTIETATFANELNDWYAFICDANASLPRCNLVASQGAEGGFGHASSPFVVNHPPVFASISNDSPVDPGDTITWTSVSYDTDTQGGNDTVRLFVCRAADFTGTACGAGGGWATSTLASSNAATTTTIAIPTQDRNYAAYAYIVDNHGLQATSTIQASNSQFTVSNVAPSVTAATISLEDTDGSGNLTLLTPSATTGPFRVEFETTDNNSCLNASSTNEISSAIANIYRSGVGQTSCDASGEYNSNSCYVQASPYFSGHISCSQDVGSCSGSSDTSATWTCTFNLWYNADPTDASTPWTAENWLSSVQVTDNNGLTSSLTESSTGNDLSSFLAFDVTETLIGYESLEPGQQSSVLGTTTDLIAVGNVGLDEDLYGDTMCTTWTTADSCDTNGINAANDIPVSNQKFATSTVAYGSTQAYTLTGSSSPTELQIRVPKTTATSSPQEKNTHWGINIPSAITLAGNYTGQNTITAKVSNFLFW